MENQDFTKYRNPTEYLKIFFRRKWLFVTPIFSGLVMGIVLSLVLPPTWEASTSILIEEEKIINPLIQNLAISTTAAQRMHSIKEVILGWSNLKELTEKLKLAKNNQSQAELEILIAKLRRTIDVRMPQTNIIKISYQGGNPAETQMVAKALTEMLVEKNMQAQTKETDVAIEFIKEQLAIYKRKIKESEIAQLQDQLKDLLSDSTERHPLVKELRQKVAIAQKELDSGDYQVNVSEQPLAESTSNALNKELDKLIEDKTLSLASSSGGGSGAYANEASRKEPDNNSYQLLLIGKLGSSTGRDIDVNEDIYNMLLQKLETAKITQRLDTSREGTRYTILDPPRLPIKPVKPDKLKVIFLGFLCGLFSGTGLVFTREFMDQSILDIEDAKNSLDLPVLGAIPRITTQEEIAGQKSKSKTRITSGIMLAAAIIIAAVLISLFKR